MPLCVCVCELERIIPDMVSLPSVEEILDMVLVRLCLLVRVTGNLYTSHTQTLFVADGWKNAQEK